MSMIYGLKSRVLYAHAWKTGGTQATKSLMDTGVASWDELRGSIKTVGRGHHAHGRLSNLEIPSDAKVCATIREPCAHIVSIAHHFYGGRVHQAYTGESQDIGAFIRALVFPEEAVCRPQEHITWPPHGGSPVQWCMENNATIVSWVIDHIYCDAQGNLIPRHWWRTDQLMDDMERDLTRWGVWGSSSRAMVDGHKNARKYPKPWTDFLTPDLVDAIQEREAWVYARWGFKAP